jgi:hypothetical protein
MYPQASKKDAQISSVFYIFEGHFLPSGSGYASHYGSGSSQLILKRIHQDPKKCLDADTVSINMERNTV